MDFGTFLVVAFSVGTVCGVPVAVLSIWTRHKQRMAELIRQPAGSSEATSSVIEELRGEIARLRDTTTQYDLSVEHTLTEIKQRLTALEARTTASNDGQAFVARRN